jgi:Recombinase.
VTDDFDSFREGVDLTVPLKNIINEFYSKDLAKKSSSAKKALWKKGKFTSAWEPYGYRKSEEDHHQLIVDEEAAEHLKSIFSMYMDGRNYSDIARQLNKDGVLSPTLQRKFYKTGEKPLPESKPWNNYEVNEFFRMFIAQVILYLENISKVFSRKINREIDQRVNGCMWRTRMKGL